MPDVNSEDKEAKVVEDELEHGEDGEDGEEEEIINADFGIILWANLDGGGVNIQVVEQGVNRKATVDDIISIIGLANAHMQGNIVSAKVAKLIEGGMRKKILKPSFLGPRR